MVLKHHSFHICPAHHTIMIEVLTLPLSYAVLSFQWISQQSQLYPKTFTLKKKKKTEIIILYIRQFKVFKRTKHQNISTWLLKTQKYSQGKDHTVSLKMSFLSFSSSRHNYSFELYSFSLNNISGLHTSFCITYYIFFTNYCFSVQKHVLRAAANLFLGRRLIFISLVVLKNGARSSVPITAALARTYARTCKMQNTRVRVRAALPSRDLLCDHRAFSPSQRAFFFFRLPFLSRDSGELSAPGHPSWILMDGDSRTRGRIPADADPQEGRMRAEKIAAWGGINFRLAFLPALRPSFPCGFFRNSPFSVNMYNVVTKAAL